MRAAAVLILLTLVAGAAHAQTTELPDCTGAQVTRPEPLTSHVMSPEAYPPLSAMLHETGATLVRYVVKEDGTVGDVTVRNTSGSLRLDDAAVAFVRDFKFKPAMLNGKPAACAQVIKIDWKLNDWDQTGGLDAFHAPTLYPGKDDYPAGAAGREEAGAAIAFILLSEDGAVERVLLVQPTGYADLDTATVEFLGKQKFTAAALNGKPIHATVIVRVVWSLAGNPERSTAPPPPSGDQPQTR